jgi:hypothetical protein
MKQSILIALLLLLGANVASAQRNYRPDTDERYERQYSKGERKAYKAQHRKFKHERRGYKRGGHHGRHHGFKGKGRRCHPHHHRRHGARR